MSSSYAELQIFKDMWAGETKGQLNGEDYNSYFFQKPTIINYCFNFSRETRGGGDIFGEK